MYIDANNLSMYLPYGGFKWVKNPQSIDIMKLRGIDEIGYISEVDLSYHWNFHNIHIDLPFLPETTVPTGGKCKKLIAHFNSRNCYVLDYRNLKQALEHDLKLESVHRVLRFKQRSWLSAYINYNTELRKLAETDFEKDFYKLLNNDIFGKSMESVRKWQHIQLVTDPNKVMKLIAKPNFKDRTI